MLKQLGIFNLRNDQPRVSIRVGARLAVVELAVVVHTNDVEPPDNLGVVFIVGRCTVAAGKFSFQGRVSSVVERQKVFSPSLRSPGSSGRPRIVGRRVNGVRRGCALRFVRCRSYEFDRLGKRWLGVIVDLLNMIGAEVHV